MVCFLYTDERDEILWLLSYAWKWMRNDKSSGRNIVFWCYQIWIAWVSRDLMENERLLSFKQKEQINLISKVAQIVNKMEH